MYFLLLFNLFQTFFCLTLPADLSFHIRLGMFKHAQYGLLRISAGVKYNSKYEDDPIVGGFLPGLSMKFFRDFYHSAKYALELLQSIICHVAFAFSF